MYIIQKGTPNLARTRETIENGAGLEDWLLLPGFQAGVNLTTHPLASSTFLCCTLALARMEVHTYTI